MSQDDRPREIIIVKHRSDDHDAHHGGVWKIAFADFMTAMMCFFLVMWLINAANEETKVSVASYFNPIKLVDRNPSRRGIEEGGTGPKVEQGSADTNNPADSDDQTSSGADTSQNEVTESEQASDAHLFKDPYAVLAEIVADSGELQNLSAKGEGGAQIAGAGTGASGGESYRDPFAPDFWSKQVEPDAPAEPDLFEQRMTERFDASSDPVAGAARAVAEADALEGEDPFAPQPATQAAVGTEAPGGPDAKEAALAEARKIAQDIRDELSKALGPGAKIADGISVEATARGLMISVTDQLDYGMFEIGSAVPRRELVLAMEKVAAVLNGRGGKVSINGHTDGRPFRNETYDNWRLSTARAHSAYYMLVRGGLDERRITEVAGHADRQLKVADDPNADRNRRIEILLETAG